MNEILKKRIEDAAMRNATCRFYDDDDEILDISVKSFEDGALWRIDSGWHDASEKPNGNNKCLVELRIPGRRNPTYKLWTWGWENSFVTRWAYIDDLLPERKEENQ